MELKLFNDLVTAQSNKVLIVPSGIETRILDENEPLTDVLIVPSGIETKQQKLNPKEEQLY